ncbi:MAG: hypothetical protein ACRCV3_02125 [Desulfovibrionaceae bacterium]
MSFIKYQHTTTMFFFFLCLLLILSSCAQKEAPIRIPSSEKITTEEIYRDANVAFNNNNFAMAEGLYKKVLQDFSFPLLYRVNVYKRLIEISAKRQDYEYMLSYSNMWLKEDTNAAVDAFWFVSVTEALLGLGNEEAIEKARVLLTTSRLSTIKKQELSVLISYLYWTTQQSIPAISLLETVWKESVSDEQKVNLENILFSYLEKTNEKTAAILSATVTQSNMFSFPYFVFSLNQARYLENEGNVAEAESIVTELIKNNVFFSKKLLSVVHVNDKKKDQKIYSKDIVLLLPMSSSYKQIAWKIINGTTIAKDSLRTKGNGTVHFINTDSGNWLQKLQKFPHGTIVGGVIQQSVFEVVQKAKLFDNYLFFTFLSRLPADVEGKNAWRFFNSPNDQIDSLLTFSTSLGLSSYAVLFPQDNYGKTMTAVFTEQAKHYKVSVPVKESYTNNANTWNAIVGKLLSSSVVNSEPVPNAKFVATFIPDTFYHATVLVPSFFFHGEQRQVILGPSLWEQDTEKQSFVESNFTLAIFPGVWNPRSSEPSAQHLRNALKLKQLPQADLWSVLGYDFIRFAFELKSKIFSLNPQDVNAILSSAPLKKWAMAPIIWSKSGLASQKLFILAPTSSGPRVVIKADFYKKLEKSYKAHNSRIEGILLEEEGVKE